MLVVVYINALYIDLHSHYMQVPKVSINVRKVSLKKKKLIVI